MNIFDFDSTTYGIVAFCSFVPSIIAIFGGNVLRKKDPDKVSIGPLLMGGGTGAIAVAGVTLLIWIFMEGFYEGWEAGANALRITVVILSVLIFSSLIFGIVLWLVYRKRSITWARLGTFLIGAGLGGGPAYLVFDLAVIGVWLNVASDHPGSKATSYVLFMAVFWVGLSVLASLLPPAVAIWFGNRLRKKSPDRVTIGPLLMGIGTGMLAVPAVFLLFGGIFDDPLQYEIGSGDPSVLVSIILGSLITLILLIGFALWSIFLKRSLQWARFGTFLIGFGLVGVPTSLIYIFSMALGY